MPFRKRLVTLISANMNASRKEPFALRAIHSIAIKGYTAAYFPDIAMLSTVYQTTLCEIVDSKVSTAKGLMRSPVDNGQIGDSRQ